jgi:hypothetical protein
MYRKFPKTRTPMVLTFITSDHALSQFLEISAVRVNMDRVKPAHAYNLPLDSGNLAAWPL